MEEKIKNALIFLNTLLAQYGDLNGLEWKYDDVVDITTRKMLQTMRFIFFSDMSSFSWEDNDKIYIKRFYYEKYLIYCNKYGIDLFHQNAQSKKAHLILFGDNIIYIIIDGEKYKITTLKTNSIQYTAFVNAYHKNGDTLSMTALQNKYPKKTKKYHNNFKQIFIKEVYQEGSPLSLFMEIGPKTLSIKHYIDISKDEEEMIISKSKLNKSMT